MDLFRKNQKIIFWIVTIIIVPSFVLVWGVSGTMDRVGAVQSFDVGQVNGKPFTVGEFEGLRKRIQAALGGIPFVFAGAPGYGTRNEDAWKYLYTSSVLQDAEKAGATASDLQVGTYIQNEHPVLSQKYDKNNPASLEKAVDDYCRQWQLSRQDFLQGVREWLTIDNYLLADGNLSVANDDSVYVYYVVNRTQYVVKRVQVKATDAIKEQAKKDVMEKPEEELQRAAREYIMSKSEDKRFREPSAWRFAYVWMPYASETTVRQPTDNEIDNQYTEHRQTLYNNLPLEEVRDRVKADLLKIEVERQTMRNFTVDVDPQLRTQGGLPLDELVKLTQLAKYGVKAAETGPAPISSTEIGKYFPPGIASDLLEGLEIVDSVPAERRAELIEQWKSGFELAGRPIIGDDGIIRIRLLDYVPSVPSAIDGPDDKVKPEFYEMALADLVGIRVEELVREKAIATEADIRAYVEAKEKGEPAPDAEFAQQYESLTAETLNYEQLYNNNDQDVLALAIGEMVGPRPYTDSETGETAQEIVVMFDRLLPSREDFAAAPLMVKDQMRQTALASTRGRMSFVPGQEGYRVVVQPSISIWGRLYDRIMKRELSINPELARQEADEG